jgi:hypothetical protein
LAWPCIAPCPVGKGNEDRLSEDQNDCNKGCIDGNTLQQIRWNAALGFIKPFR